MTQQNSAEEIRTSTASVVERYRTVQERVAEACVAAGRSPDEVQLLVVTKFHPLDAILELINAGVRDFGENREQEARAKAQDVRMLDEQENLLADNPVHWAMVGQLQRKKCNAVARWADSVHSVDSLRLIEGLERGVVRAYEEGERATSQLGVFLQVSLDGDVRRGGALPDSISKLADAVQNSPHLALRGLMAVPPLKTDSDEEFSKLLEMSLQLRKEHPDAKELSAGMTQDMESAIRHGSTCVRVGTAIMGPRPTPQKI